MDWFSSILNLLDSSPPAEDSNVHLLLDRFWRETTDVASLESDGEVAGLSSQLAELTQDEIERTRDILAVMNENVSEFEDAISSLANEKPISQFISARTLIIKSILQLCSANYRLSESKVPDELVKDMVEHSSELLRTTLDKFVAGPDETRPISTS